MLKTNCINRILFPFHLANKHFNEIPQSEWKGKIVHLITGVLEYIFPINYIIALFDRTVFKEIPQEKKPSPHPTPRPPKEGVERPVIIGIDLGTTNSCVAYMKDGTVEVLADDNGARITPSIISSLYSTKRFIGRKFDEVQSEISAVPYKVTKNENGDAVFEVDGKIVTPEEAGANILLKMKQIAEARLGKPVTKAIVTVPAYFNAAQRQATREAGRIAGLDVVRIITEPTAAALAYGIDKSETPQTIAVYDLGGGTFDVSILKMENGIFEVLAINGDTHLGGDDFDAAIVNWMVAECKNRHQIDLSPDKMPLLRDAAIKAKIELSTLQSTPIELSTDSKTVTIELSRTQLEEICRPLIERSLEPCRKAMKDAKLSAKQIDQAVLVGGMTRMPAVQQAVEKIFKRTPNTSVNPDEAVAIGAAIQGSVLAGDPTNVLLMDVNPLTLGIEVEGRVIEPLIQRNAFIPISVSKIFSTADDNQRAVRIQVYQGERPMSRDNKKIGEFELAVPPAPRGKLQIEVNFEINGDGILQVKAKEKQTGKEQKIRIAEKSSLTMEEIEDQITQAKAHQENDKLRKEEVNIRQEAKQLVLRGEQFLNEIKIFPPKVLSFIADLKQALEGTEALVIKAKTKELEDELLAFDKELSSSSRS